MSIRDEVLKTDLQERYLETYEDYKKNILPKALSSNKQWLDDIIEGRKEQELILYQDKDFILLISDKWTDNNIDHLRILSFFKNKKLKSIRDLTNANIKLLEKVKNKSCEVIKEKYNFTEDQLKIFFHYRPSVWQLHLHFVNLNYKLRSSSVEKAFEYHGVIENLKLISDYYKKISIYTFKKDVE
jgi:m7GpppX diphosphatase